MKIRKSDVVSIGWALVLTLLLHIDGLIRYTFRLEHQAGAYNPQLAILVFLGLFTLYAKQVTGPWLLSGSLNIKRYTLWVIGALGILISLGSSGEPSKIVRDVLYLLTMALTYLNLRAYQTLARFNSRTFLRTLMLGTCILLPGLAFVFFYTGTERFGGFMLSEPIFANSLVILMTMAFAVRLERAWLVAGSFFSSVWIFLSGTRTALFLLLLLLGYAWLFDFGRKRLSWRRGLMTIGFFAGLLGLASVTILQNAEALSSVRILSVADTEGGSLETRTLWYVLLINQLMTERLIGGFGAGASEAFIGAITHFDFLRFWYDYSLIYLGVFGYLLYRLTSRPPGGYRSPLSTYALSGYLGLSALLFSMHNVFQSPSGVVMMTLLFFFAFPWYGPGESPLAQPRTQE